VANAASGTHVFTLTSATSGRPSFGAAQEFSGVKLTPLDQINHNGGTTAQTLASGTPANRVTRHFYRRIGASAYSLAARHGASLFGMDLDEVTRNCDELHECVDQGPGERPQTFARALSVVRRLRAEAPWSYPLTILGEIETQLARWFSPDNWGGTNNGRTARADLLTQIARLEDAWERPRA
jgi:hypothetical protein